MEEIIVIIFVVIFIATFIVAFLKKRSSNVYKDYVSMENIPQEFKEIYTELYVKNVEHLEQLRKSILTKNLVFGIAIVILFFVIISVVPKAYLLTESFMDLIVFGVFGIILIFVLVTNKYRKRYADAYKHNIISKFIKLVNKNLKYTSLGKDASIARTEYMKADFDNKPFNRFYGDDYIEGNLEDDVNVKIFDIHLQNVVKRGKNTYTEEVFQGIFSIVTSSKNIETTITISRNKLKILDSKNRIQMDSGEFEEYFDVYAQDKITAMRILTSDVIQCLLDFQNRYQLDFEIVFKNNIVYSRFFTGPMFEPKIMGDSMDEALIFRYYTILKFIIELTRAINETKENLDM